MRSSSQTTDAAAGAASYADIVSGKAHTKAKATAKKAAAKRKAAAKLKAAEETRKHVVDHDAWLTEHKSESTGGTEVRKNRIEGKVISKNGKALKLRLAQKKVYDYNDYLAGDREKMPHWMLKIFDAKGKYEERKSTQTVEDEWIPREGALGLMPKKGSFAYNAPILATEATPVGGGHWVTSGDAEVHGGNANTPIRQLHFGSFNFQVLQFPGELFVTPDDAEMQLVHHVATTPVEAVFDNDAVEREHRLRRISEIGTELRGGMFKKYAPFKIFCKGAFGEILIGTDTNGKKIVAKWFHGANIASQECQNMVRNEIMILKNTNHDNVVKFYEYKYNKHEMYIFLEYCNGGDLLQYINTNGVVKDYLALNIFNQLLNGSHC